MGADFSLRPLRAADLPALQRVYEAAAPAFTRRLGRPAGPQQAAADFMEAQADPARFQFGVFVGDEMIGLADCKLAADVAQQAHLGLLLLAERYDDPAIAALALRILARWLGARFGVRRLEISVPAHDAAAIAFWREQGFSFTGEQYRRELPGFAPRFLVMAKEIGEGA